MEHILQKEGFKTIRLVGNIVIERPQRMLGHILHKPIPDVMRKLTCDNNLVRPQQLYKRCGAHRTRWLEDGLVVAMKSLTNSPDAEIEASEAHIDFFLQATIDRKN